MSSSGVAEPSQVAHATATTDTRVTSVENDRGVSRWSVAQYEMRYEDTLDARRFRANFLDGTNSFIFDLRNVRWDMDIDD